MYSLCALVYSHYQLHFPFNVIFKKLIFKG